MGRLARIAFLGIVALGAVAQSEYHQRRTDVEPEHNAWVAGVLRATQTITVGMTRSDLMKIFTTEGGLSTASHHTYVFRQCPLIKVDVKFAVSSHGEELPTDKIVEVSRPYLAWSVFD